MTADIVSLDAVKAERKLRARQERAIAHTVAYILATVGPLASPADLEAFRDLVAEEAARDRALFGDDIAITDEAS
jgi:hypothetical protein